MIIGFLTVTIGCERNIKINYKLFILDCQCFFKINNLNVIYLFALLTLLVYNCIMKGVRYYGHGKNS